MLRYDKRMSKLPHKRHRTKKNGEDIASQEYLGHGTYGTVRGLSSASIRQYISRNRGISKDYLTVRKQYKRQADYKKALELDNFIQVLDPYREYLRGQIISRSEPSVIVMKNQGQNIKNYGHRIKPIFENTYQLLLAIYILFRTRAIHYDIKMANIVIDDRSPVQGVYRLGLIDYDLLVDADVNALGYSNIYYIWPMEKHIFQNSFCPIIMHSFKARMKCTMKIIEMWEKQSKILGYLIHEPSERQNLINLVKVAIIHRNFPDIQDIHEYWDSLLSQSKPEDHDKLLSKKKVMLRIKDNGVRIATTPDKNAYTKNPIVLEYIKAFFEKPLPFDWTKMDPFGLGLVLIEVFLQDPSFFAGNRTLQDAVRSCLFKAVHPDPTQRHDARSFLQEWLGILSIYGDRGILREALHECRHVISMLAKNPRATKREKSLDLSGYQRGVTFIQDGNISTPRGRKRERSTSLQQVSQTS